MKSTIAPKVIDEMHEQIVKTKERFESELWVLHKRLGEAYSNKHDQIADAKQVGEIAAILESCNNVLSKIQDYRFKYAK